ncbi:hypothetical protein GALL_85590 [mine drainage metagenome]|uniref:Uncharacterized protein n=1 Tax=mine drainage metagenome TaxID=410659 RepID=A0A1J5TB18_9ZZZZ
MQALRYSRRTSLETRIEAAAERLLAKPTMVSAEIDLTPSLRLIRASDAPDEAQDGTSTTYLPYIYRSEWFYVVNTAELSA